MIKVEHQNCVFDLLFTHYLKSDVVFKKARQSLYIPKFKYVPVYGLEHFHRPQRRKRKRQANMYSWFSHCFFFVFDGCKQKTHNVSRNLIVLLCSGAGNAIQTHAFPWTAPQKIIHTHVFCVWPLFVCISYFRGHSDEKCKFHDFASLVHKPFEYV